MADQESLADYFKRVGVPVQKSAPTPVKQESLSDYFSRQPQLKAADVAPNPTDMGSNATQAYTSTMQQNGYQPMADQAGSAFNSSYDAAQRNNLELARQQYSREQDLALKEGQGVVPLQLPKEVQEKVTGYQNAFNAIDNVEQHYSQALKSPFFGGNFRGGTPLAALGQQTDDRVKQFNTATELASTPLANGVLNYTSGADSKATVIDKLNDIMPNAKDAFNTGSGKLLQMRQMTLQNLQNLRSTVATSGNYNTAPIDNLINQYAPKVAANQQWYDNTFNSNSNPGNPGSAMSAGAQQVLDAAAKKPVPSPTSQFSPVGGATPMPAAQQPQPVPGL